MAPRGPAPDRLTPLELDVMNALWDHGAGTVQEVQERLQRERALAYTTVQTVLNLLCAKGRAARTRRERAFVYRARVTREREASRTLGDVIEKLFGGSAESLVMNLVESRHLDAAKLAALRRKIEKTPEDTQ